MLFKRRNIIAYPFFYVTIVLAHESKITVIIIIVNIIIIDHPIMALNDYLVI